MKTLVCLSIPQKLFKAPIETSQDLVSFLMPCMVFAGVACRIQEADKNSVSLVYQGETYEFSFYRPNEAMLELVAPKDFLQYIATGLYYIALDTFLTKYRILCDAGKRPRKKARSKKVWVTFSEKENEIKKLRHYKILD